MNKFSTTALLCFILLAGCAGKQEADTEPATDSRNSSAEQGDEKPEIASAKDEQPPAAKPIQPDSSEKTLKDFMMGVATQDRMTIQRVTMQLTDEELDILCEGQPIPPNKKEEVIEQIANAKVVKLVAGDTWALPGGKKNLLTEEMFQDGRTMLRMEMDPIPFNVYQVEGRWRVDAGPMVKIRKKAKELRNR